MPKTALLFPGQGAQFVGMGAKLAATLPAAQGLFDRAAEVLGYDLLGVCARGPKERLDATDVSQPAIYVASLAALEQLKVTDPGVLETVVCAAGLSLGEYTALTYAGSLTFEDGLKVVDARGKAMQAAAEATPSGMVSLIGPSVLEVEALVAEVRDHGVLRVANLLCPGNTVVSGAAEAIDAVVTLAEARGVRAMRLSVAGAFHTSLMRPADDALGAALDTVALHAASVPVYSNVNAAPHTEPDEVRPLLIQQVLAPVKWEDSMRAMLAAGVDNFVEVGPGRVLSGLLKRVDRKIAVTQVPA